MLELEAQFAREFPDRSSSFPYRGEKRGWKKVKKGEKKWKNERSLCIPAIPSIIAVFFLRIEVKKAIFLEIVVSVDELNRWINWRSKVTPRVLALPEIEASLDVIEF